MAICDICGKKVDEVFACEDCGAHFCKNDGDAEIGLCANCINKKKENQKEANIKQDEVDIIHEEQSIEQEDQDEREEAGE
jgi:hypothetical protein